MGRGHGSTRSRGASRNSGVTTVFTGGYQGSAKDTASIQIYNINKETDKALQVKTLVEWGSGSAHQKDIWVPKSTIANIQEHKGSDSKTLNMAKWMAQKIAKENSYKGYSMDFSNSYNVWG